MPQGAHGWGGGSSSVVGMYGKKNATYALTTLYLVLLVCFLRLPCKAVAELRSSSDVGKDFPASPQQQALYSTLPAVGSRWQEPVSTEHKAPKSTPLHLQPGPERKPGEAERNISNDEGKTNDDKQKAELFVRARQIQFYPEGTKWVELKIEVLGSDGKINKQYNGGIAASLILANSDKTPTKSQKEPLTNRKGITSDRAVSIASSVATDGVAILRFSPPTDGTYRFSITCGGCNHKLNTGKHYFSAGTNAVLKVVSQPSGASSGALLVYQPAVQLEDRYGRPLHVKNTVVASILPIDPHQSERVPLASWTLETDEHGYAKATEIRVTKAGQHVIQFVTTLWNDTRLEVSSDSFEVVPGPATAAVFSLNPPSRVLLREPFSVVAFLVDSYGNETTTPPELQRKGNPVEAHLSAFNKAGRKVSLHGHTTQVWGGGKISFEGLWFSEPDHITLKVTCTLCAKDTPRSSAEMQVVSVSRVYVHPMPMLVEPRVTKEGEGKMPSREFWGQLRISLKAEDWGFGAPQKPVSVEVRKITLLDPLRGLAREDGAKYLRVEPTRLLFSVENAATPQIFYVLPWSPGVIVGSEGLSQPQSSVHLGAFSIELEAISEDPAWSSSAVVFDLPSPALAPGISLGTLPGLNDLTVYVKDGDTNEILTGFPQQQLVREGEAIAYTLRLSACPLENEEIAVRIHGDRSGGYSVQPELLQFTASNWQEEQTVSLTIDQDDIAPSGDELSLEGSTVGNVIRTLVLRHEVSSSEDSVWRMRGGKDVAFSVWDDDIAGVEWAANASNLIQSENFTLAFRLRSQPVAEVALQLQCEGTQIVAQLDRNETLLVDTPQLGKVTVQPAKWQTEHEFLLRLKAIEETPEGVVTQNGENGAIFHTSCSLKAVSDDPNYDTGRNFTGQQHLLTLRGFRIPLAISRISSQSLTDGHNKTTDASILTCAGAHYLRMDKRTVECLPCPPGYECPNPKEPPKPCPPEHMSLGGFPFCVPCPEGFTCPAGTAVPKQLKPGFYHGISVEGNNVRTNTNAATPCPEGFYCAGGSASPVPCLPGYVSDKGASECIPCPAGFMCKTSRAADLEACPEGSYSLRGESACRPCPAGFACTVRKDHMVNTFRDKPTAVGLNARSGEGNAREDSEIARSPSNFVEQSIVELLLPCKAGYFSGEGDAGCIPCGGAVACPTPLTMEHCFVPFTVALPDDPTECVPCPAGHTCIEGIVKRCPDFHYARLGEGVCRLCKGGYLCKGGATAPDEGDLVPIGYYRSERDDQAYPCPSGTLGLIPGATSEQNCSPCPSGYMCEMKDEGGEFLRSSASLCPAGYICLPVAVPCPYHYYQPNTGSTSTQCIPCDSGHRTTKTGSISCEGCVGYTFCTSQAGVLPCRYSSIVGPVMAHKLDECSRQPGEFIVYTEQRKFASSGTCPEGSAHPDDLVGGGSGLFSMEAYGSCINCPGGQICSGGRVPSTITSCAPGYYCPRGTTPPTQFSCPTGTESLSTSSPNYSQCTRCNAGYVCSSSKKSSCPQGFYCLEGSWNAYRRPCPAGTVSALLGATSKVACISTLAGFWAPVGSLVATMCGRGNYCLPGSTEPTPCPRKTFSSLISGLLNDCIACPKNKICPEGSMTTYSCPTGFYHDTSGEGQCVVCPLGYTCSSGQPVACSSGFYGEFVPQKNSRDCVACPQGYYCDGTGLTIGGAKPCTAGFTCNTAGLDRPKVECPAGYYCPLGTAYSYGTPCPPGTWSNRKGLVSSSQCKPVKAGSFSYEGEKKEEGSGKCAKGFYCPERSTTSMAVACPPGTYNAREGGASLADCLSCPAGKDCSTSGTSELRDCPTSYYCPEGSSKVVPCPVGTYSNTQGLMSEDQCTKCPAGQFCSIASLAAPSGNCEPGFICHGGATTPTPTDGVTGEQCPPGGYCPAGATKVTPCLPGYYNPRWGAGSPSACLQCPLGSYCDGNVVNESGVTGICEEGYFCEEGSQTAQAQAAQPGTYAPAGSSSSLLCYPGTYQDESGRGTCKACPAGKYCQQLGMVGSTECPKASYCPEGSAAPKLCPPGTHSANKNLQADSECTACPGGSYCGDYGLESPSGKCQAGFYCTGGSASSAPQETTGNNRICPVGHYCIAGSTSPTQCQDGTYSPSQQATSQNACIPCDPGKVCSGTGLSSPGSLCPGGYYCPGGTQVQCTAGHECPEGSASPIPCKPGTYAESPGQESCTECPAGSYCESTTKVPTTSEQCPAGYFCPPGTAFAHENPCPQGTINKIQGATSLDDCKPCPAGHYCVGPAATGETGKVAGGHYSMSGAMSAIPVPGCRILAAIAGVQKTECKGQESPILAFADATAKCLENDACQGIVETPQKTFLLRCGTFSRVAEEKLSFFHPKICTVGGTCKPGTYCPEGATEPQQCPAGSYCAHHGLIAASGQCTAGYNCPAGSSSPHDVSALCLPGHYCPGNAVPATPCDAGKVLGGFGGSKADDCLPCPAGYYCDQQGLSLPAGACAAGKYCPAGTENLGNATECKAGHMCPEGSAAPVPCPRGTKQPETGKASCISCGAGEICSEGSTAGKTCQVGFTCPEGTSVNTSFPCPPGTFSDRPGSCTSCPQGFYCDAPASDAVSGQCRAGYYCPAGTKWKEPTTICKHGEICPPGSNTPQDCPPNHFCSTSKLGEPSGPCSGGFVCNSRSTSPRPTGEQNGSVCDENMQGRPCLKGHYCPRPDSPLIAGTGFAGSSGDGLPGPETLLKLPANAIMDPNTRDIYVADYSNYAVKVVHGDTGTVETLVSGASVSGALSWIQSTSPVGLAFCQTTKKLYISYPGRNAIVEHDVALRSSALLSDISAQLSKPLGLDIDADCSKLYIADSGSHRVLRHALAGSPAIETVIGTGTAGNSDPASATVPSSFQINLPSGVALHNDKLYVVDSANRRVLEVALNQNSVKVLVGAGNSTPGSGQPPSDIVFETPVSAAIADREGDVLLVVADIGARALRKIDLSANTISTLKDFSAWRSSVVDDAETSIATAGLEEAFYGISTFYGKDKKRTGVLLADSFTHRIRRIELEGDLYSSPVVLDIQCPEGTYLPYTGAASEAECIQCPYGMYCSSGGLIEPEGPCTEGYYCPRGTKSPTEHKCAAGHYCSSPSGRIGARARRPNTRELPLQRESLTSSDLTANIATHSSGWFTRRPGTACCSGAGRCPHGAVANQGKEEIFVVELEKPTDLLGIRIHLEGSQYPATLLGVDVNHENGCSTLWGPFAGFDGSIWSTPYARARRRRFLGANKSAHRIMGNNGEELKGVKSVIFRFVPGVQSIMAYASLTTNATRGPVAQKKCPPGTYQPEAGARSCKVCPAGSYCDGFGMKDPKQCLEGFVCPEGSTIGTSEYCKIGWISQQTGSSNTNSCLPCEKGKFCAQRGATKVSGMCSAGYYCKGGSWTATPLAGMVHPETGEMLDIGDICPSNHYCTEGASAPTACPIGTFSQAGVTSESGCFKCSAGFACISKGVQVPCAAGYVCLEGSNTATPNDQTMGYICPAGHYCPEGSFAEKQCPSGTFSSQGQASCTPCSPGKYCSSPGSNQDGINCPAGHFCGEQTIVPQPCKPGTFQDQEGQASCKLCPRGYYCPNYRATSATEKCHAGTICVAGATHPRIIDYVYSFANEVNGLCPPGHFCGAGATQPTPCPGGQYQGKAGGTSCVECPAGKYCAGDGNTAPTGDCAPGYVCHKGAATRKPTDGTKGEICPKGFYCEEGTTHARACAPGTYTSTTGQHSCQPCPEGFYCNRPGAEPQKCPSQKVCPEGSAEPGLCPRGSVPSSGSDPTDTCVPCPQGKYCRGAVEAGDCLAGFFCGLGNWVPNPWMEQVPNEPFVPESIASSGGFTLLTLDNWEDVKGTGYGGIPCPPGHYCPAGTTEPKPCPAGSVRQATLGRWEGDCSLCPKGFYCPPLSLVPEPCPAGHFCPLGSSEPRPCMGGTYNPHTEGSSTASCLICLPGYLCPGEGNGEVTKENQCPAGHYCLEGSQTAIPCPPGTYSDENGLTSEAGCKPCPAGNYCPMEGLSKPGLTCPMGHSCPLGTAIPRKCLQGTWCPSGSGEPQPCPAGALCPIGSGIPLQCPPGSYCPLDQSTPIPCPAGYMGAEDRSDTTSLEAGCTICPAGTYSSEPGMTTCQPCTPGYVCLEGCNSRKPTSIERDKGFRCAPGTYCPTGSTSETPCPAGTYGIQAASSSAESCYPCPSGTYNSLEGQTGCILCGATGTSNSSATSCSCKGANRSFQMADRSCVCLSGFHYLEGKEDLSDQDGVEPCQQTLYDECTDDAVRDSTGACTSPKEICDNQCGPAGGTFSTISGLCSCVGEKSLDEVCDETCRAARPQMILKGSKLLIEDPETTLGDKAFALQDLTTQTGLATGSYECDEEEGCTVRMFDTTLAKMTGLVGVPQSFVDEVTERLQKYGIVPELPSTSENEGTGDTENNETTPARRLALSVDFGYFGVSDPVQCLPLGSTVAWHIRPSPNPIYPVYLRNNLLNTNKQFDYGAFRELDTDMKGGEQRILFIFTFKEPGVYVFGLNSDQNKIMVLRVMEPKRLCREDALLPQLRTAETLAAIAARLPTTIQTSGWLLFISVVLGILLMAVLFFFAAWTIKHQRLEKLEADPKSKYNQPDPQQTNTKTAIKEVEDLILPNQTPVPMEEDPGVLRARRALAKKLETQDPRIFIAVLNLAKQIQQEAEKQCGQILAERSQGLSQLLEQTKELKQALSVKLQDAAASEVWMKEPDEEREEILSTLLSLLRLRRRDLVNRMAREEKEHQEEEALKGKGEQLLLLSRASSMWSRHDSLVSSIILPAVGEKGQTQISSIKLSVEAQIEELLEEFRNARADADDDMPSIIEIYKAKMKSLLEEAQGETNLAFKNMLSADIEEQLITGSASLDLREARMNLTRTEDDAQERKTLEIYRVLAEAAWKLTVYTAAIEQEIMSSTQAVNKAAFEGKQAVEITKADPGEAVSELKAAVMTALKEGRSRIQEAASEAEKAISSAEAQAQSQLDSWTDNLQAELRDVYDGVLDAQNKTLNCAFATESRLLKASMQTTKNQILERIRSRYDRMHSLRCSDILEELQITLTASISEANLKTRQKHIDDAVNEASNEINRLRDAELESAVATLNRTIAARTNSVHKRQSAFKSRKLLMLQKRQETEVQQVPVQAQSAVALLRRALSILKEQLRAATTYEATLFQNVAKFGVDMAVLIKENTQDLSAPATLMEGLKRQQGEALAKYRDQLIASVRNQRQAATEELWDLEQRERKRIDEFLEDQTAQLEAASNRLEEAIAKEEAVREEYENAVFKLKQQNQRGMKELQTIQALSAFKQKLLSKINDTFLSRANEARSKGITDPDTDDRLQQEWRIAEAELEPVISREKETYSRYADLAFQVESENAQSELRKSQQNRQSQAALAKTMEQAEEEGDDDMLNKRRALGTDEVQRIVWRICALLSSGVASRTDSSGPHFIVPDERRDDTVEELRQQLRRRRKRHLDYCIAQRNIIEGGPRSALAAIQSETIQGLSGTSEDIDEFSRGSATVNAADSSAAILEIMEEAQQKLNEALEEIQKEQEEAEEKDRVNREQEIAERQKAHELAKQKLNEEHQAKLAAAPEDTREELLKEHEKALKQMESAVAAELQEQEERAQKRLLERQQRLQQKRREAEEQKQRAIEQAKAELEEKIAAEAKQKEEAAECEELQRLVSEGNNPAAVAELLARKHERESLSLLQELSMRKAEEISALTEKFWNEKGGRICEGRPDDLQELYKAELQEYLFVQTRALDDRITLQMQDLQQRQTGEAETTMKRMERRAKLAQETALPQMSEEEQYARLHQEAEAAAAEEVEGIEKRMMEEQEKLLKEMEEKRNAYDKVLDKLKHRKMMEEKREALRQEQEQRRRAGEASGLGHLMSQYEEHRKLLEEALAEEAARQHKQARQRVLLRNVERSERLYQKRLAEKQRFLVNQNEIRRRELGLSAARAAVRTQRNFVETLNEQELKRRMELARRLEEERHWAPIWREILEEEQNAGTFDSWDLEDEQINFAGPFATSVLHTERMLQSESSYMRKLIGGFQQLSELITVIHAAAKEKAAAAAKGDTKASGRRSSSAGNEGDSTDSSSSDSSSSTDDSSDSEDSESSSELEQPSSDSSSEEPAVPSSSDDSSSSSSSSSSSESSSEDSSSSSSSSEADSD